MIGNEREGKRNRLERKRGREKDMGGEREPVK
jgi:hypothetical protein